jgi:hypothetical protein
MRFTYPVKHLVEFTGSTPAQNWDGEVYAMSHDQAIVLATIRASNQAHTVFTHETRVKVTRLEKS